MFRWMATLFFLAYLIVSGLSYSSDSRDDGPLYFIYLTNWSFLALNVHLLWSAISVTIRYFQVHIFCRERYEVHKLSRYHVYDKPAGCCGVQKDGTVWYQKVQWLFFNIGTEAAIGVSILYWALIHNSSINRVDHINIVTHALNGIIALVDIGISGVPVRILHVVYPVIFCGSYSVFTGVYYGAGGTNQFNQTFIYPVLDYETSPATSSGYILGVTLVFCPLVHLLIWGLYLAREGLLHLIKHVCCKECFGDEKDASKSIDEEMQDR